MGCFFCLSTVIVNQRKILTRWVHLNRSSSRKSARKQLKLPGAKKKNNNKPIAISEYSNAFTREKPVDRKQWDENILLIIINADKKKRSLTPKYSWIRYLSRKKCLQITADIAVYYNINLTINFEKNYRIWKWLIINDKIEFSEFNYFVYLFAFATIFPIKSHNLFTAILFLRNILCTHKNNIL